MAEQRTTGQVRPEDMTDRQTDRAPSDTAQSDARRCPECSGIGSYSDHHPDCFGGGPTCERLYPVQVPCQRCNTTGLISDTAQSDDFLFDPMGQ